MNYFTTPNQSRRNPLFILFYLIIFALPGYINAQEPLSASPERECINCFSSEITEISVEDNCIHVNLMVRTIAPCNAALSHLVVELPCGIVSNVYNSGGWPVETYIADPTTGLTGFKIDNIQGFGENRQADSLYISYTVCSKDPLCLDEIQSGIILAYKAATCVFTEELSEESDIQLNLAPEDVPCYGNTNGAIYSEVSGGQEPYSFQWNNGSTEPDLQNIGAGSYTLIVTDALGAIAEKTAVVNQPESPVSIEGEVLHASCNASDGAVNVTVSGGVSPYTFKWSNGDTTQNLTGVSQGSWNLTATDATGCSTNKTFTILENNTLNIALTPNYLECYEEGQGEISSEVTGGTEPYEYQWSNGEVTPNISGVNSGLYSLNIVDAEGCTMKKSAYIGIRKLSINAVVKNPTCHGDEDGEVSIISVGYGTGPFHYVWDTGDTTESLTGLASGQYEVTVTDSMECSTTRRLHIADPPEVSLNYSVAPRDCKEISPVEVLLDGSGGSGKYEFYLADTLIGPNVILPGIGDYDIYVTDSKGCDTSQTIHIENSDNFNIVASIVQPSCTGIRTGYASFTATGGAAPFTWKWPDGSGGSSKAGLEAGDYSIEVIDANGCFVASSFTIDSINEVSVRIENPGSPPCNSDNNALNATSTNATDYSWSVSASDGNWSAISSTMDQLVYHAGNDTALIMYHAWNEEGCEDTDSLILVCSSGDPGNPPDDPGDDDGGDNDDGEQDGDCQSLCWETEIAEVSPLGNNCYAMELLVKTMGYCRHDLSHLVVGFDNAWISDASNSGNFKMEANATDPKSGVTGLKIDDINGFGNDGMNEFRVAFEICFSNQENEYLPDVIPVIYKAATCTYLQELPIGEVNTENAEIFVSAYPNPFVEEINIRLNSAEDTEVSISLFDLRGNKIAQLYDGKLKANVNYTFPFRAGNNTNEKIFIYSIISPDQVIWGQILRQ